MYSQTLISCFISTYNRTSTEAENIKVSSNLKSKHKNLQSLFINSLKSEVFLVCSRCPISYISRANQQGTDPVFLL